MAKVNITETILRDAHQSLLATRMSTEEMLPVLEKLDKVGYYSLEMWGGATFDSCLRFLNEDPWDRLRIIRSKVKNTRLQMLLRGQNLLGYKHYPDDVVDAFIKKSIENGIDIIRVFDALNDVRNMTTAISSIKKYKGHAQGTVVYTLSPVHTNQTYLNIAHSLEDLGCDSICIKDMAGLLTPYAAYDLIKLLKSEIGIPIHLHSHFTTGVADMTYLKAVEAGVDALDTALSPLAYGTSQPATEPLVAALKGTQFDTDLDADLLNEIAEHFKKVKANHITKGITLTTEIDTKAFKYQIPGGMLSNLVSQLKTQNAVDKYDAVLKEVPEVRKDLGYPPLVTPMSQMVGTQATFNVLSGERYKIVPKEIKDYVKGLYGKTPVPIDEKIKRKIIGDDEIITTRPADLLEPQLDNIKKEIAEYIEQEEDILTYAMFPQIALNYFKLRQAKKYKLDQNFVDYNENVHPI